MATVFVKLFSVFASLLKKSINTFRVQMEISVSNERRISCFPWECQVGDLWSMCANDVHINPNELRVTKRFLDYKLLNSTSITAKRKRKQIVFYHSISWRFISAQHMRWRVTCHWLLIFHSCLFPIEPTVSVYLSAMLQLDLSEEGNVYAATCVAADDRKSNESKRSAVV